MRIIAGSSKGKRLFTPKAEKRIRPALDQVKEAIFSILFSVEDERVLDIFAGTGSLGLEAISRGAKNVIFVDASAIARELIEKNILVCDCKQQAIILQMHADRAIRQLGARNAIFDLIFIDPPYERDLVNETLALTARRQLLAPKGRIVIEHHPNEAVIAPDGLNLTDQRKYGQTLISFLTHADKSEK